MRHNFPYARPGQVIGLLGGSFDPAHEGHVHITREALKRFGLDQIWWLVTPGNPLKEHGPAPLAQRVDHARDVMQHPRVKVTQIEAYTGTRYTAETLERLITLYPGVQFIWLMGADNLADFHRWERWDWIMSNVPVGILARPGDRGAARMSNAARRFRLAQIPGRQASKLRMSHAPAWSLVNVPMLDVSSSQIRARGDW
ncbi:nicotinate-nucleotide adenylyltransferase [Aliiroseovarius halocynthiae]|uniref:Probable nicotinate-nucleotide adenylyltransferase n=1 Tax=Aliiroseovarius halocynthiae TaxID=985055 RepID=A0A545SSH5_9RHOB|nr:nicotinate-nucleotide adenylyltransferase [Aliiroseovarius halocynthiae]TQV67919.1 nicotinate-nucleotide adenylyltransferase [Aliiroseovarius halocynthiae]SMR73019.1 nicotinate-nucleotide adenylyltransferase [Aliiroseovarius halocynthiae]